MSQTAATSLITAEHVRQYQEEGYFILPRAVPDPMLRMLRDEVQHKIDLIHHKMDQAGADVLGLCHRHKRYFVGLSYKDSPRLAEFLFSDLMAEVCRATLGPTAYLFYELFVVKCAEVGMKFGWHQDSGYVEFEHTPYLTCWIPLVDVDEQNGTVYVLPYSRAGTRQRVEHVLEPGSNDKVGYFGADPGIPAIVPAGSLVCFSSTVFHRSGPNQTQGMRPAYVVQYSAQELKDPASGQLKGFADAFLKDGRRVR